MFTSESVHAKNFTRKMEKADFIMKFYDGNKKTGSFNWDPSNKINAPICETLFLCGLDKDDSMHYAKVEMNKAGFPDDLSAAQMQYGKKRIGRTKGERRFEWKDLNKTAKFSEFRAENMLRVRVKPHKRNMEAELKREAPDELEELEHHDRNNKKAKMSASLPAISPLVKKIECEMQVMLTEAGVPVDETNIVDKFMSLPYSEKKEALLKDLEMYVLYLLIVHSTV